MWKFFQQLSVCDSLADDKASATASHLHQLLSEEHCSSLIGFSDIYPSIDAIKTDFYEALSPSQKKDSPTRKFHFGSGENGKGYGQFRLVSSGITM